MCSRVVSASAWKRSTMSAHASGVFSGGTEPPPDRIEPSPSALIGVGSVKTESRSAWVIWPTFSSSVIRWSRSLTRWLTGSRAFSYGNFCAAPAGATTMRAATITRAATTGLDIDLLPCQEGYKRVWPPPNRARVCRHLTNPRVVRLVTSVGRNQRRGGLLARAVHDEQLGGAGQLEDA